MVALDRAVVARAYNAPHEVPTARIYRDAPLRLRGTVMSAPSGHARAAAALRPALDGRDNARVLDVGAGSGYVSALLALLVVAGEGDTTGARVVALEKEVALAEAAKRAATAGLLATTLSAKHTSASLLVAVAADGRAGHPPLAPYHAIHVGGSCEHVPPALVAQLAPGGRLLLAVGASDEPQDLTLVERHADSGRVTQTVLHGGLVMFGLT